MAKASDVMRCIAIILDKEPNAETCAEHDEIWCGSTPPEIMGIENTKELRRHHWDWVVNMGSWRRYT